MCAAPLSPGPGYDAVLLVSFGGPEGPDDVMPFLRNVTRGRGIPAERLTEVAGHYHRFGGRSPINDQNRALLVALRAELATHGPDLPVYWGNRNWTPFLADTVTQMRNDGIRRALAVVTSAYSSYSACRQYLENLAGAAAAAGEGAPVIDKIRPYFNHPGFVEAVTASTARALADLPPGLRAGARLAFVAHSLPTAMARASGPDGDGYVTQLREVARLVADAVGGPGWDVVYCSRSGAPSVPWLEPDVCDHLDALHADGAAAVVLVPVGFVSDHMEVIFDLDDEAVGHANRIGLPVVRAATVATDPRFVGALRDLVAERALARPGRAAVGCLHAWPDVCQVGCCPPGRAAGNAARA